MVGEILGQLRIMKIFKKISTWLCQRSKQGHLYILVPGTDKAVCRICGNLIDAPGAQSWQMLNYKRQS